MTPQPQQRPQGFELRPNPNPSIQRLPEGNPGGPRPQLQSRPPGRDSIRFDESDQQVPPPREAETEQAVEPLVV
jgi:hypothetical protein